MSALASVRAPGRVPAGTAVRAAAVAALALFVANATLGPRVGIASAALGEGLYNGLLLLATGACIARVVRVREARAAWLALSIGMLSWTLGDLHYAFAYSSTETPPFPSVGDALYLVFYPASYVALVLLIRTRVRDFQRTLWIDGAMAALAAAAIGASVVFELVLTETHGSTAAIATNLAYPLGDVALLALVVGVYAFSGWRTERAWAFIGLGLLSAAVADAVYLYRVAEGTYVEGGLLDALWPASLLLLAQAAWQRPRSAAPIQLEGRRLLVAPAVCGLVATGLLTYDHWVPLNGLALVLAVATIAIVIVRMDVTFRDKQRLLAQVREQALTDTLTRLGNRRRLLDDLRRLLASAEPPPSLLLLFDLDGFKRYNDTFGHPAGDALLALLGRKLDAAVSGHGTAYRLGGDEFCVLASVAGGDGEALIDATAAALSERGDGFAVGSSFGAVFLPDEARDGPEALRLADQRLYAQKAGKASGRGHPQDVLLQALYEREPALREHVHDVATLAMAVGRRLALDGAALDELLRAAELHDVGKLAVPDDVLRKPGRLHETEWELVRRHTLVGERILSASPALVGVARIVRSTHEHWDGSGYPDGLAGEEIPLAARIILAADAFVAMTAVRSYGGAVGEGAALAELRRCAGSQFDPAVVSALAEARHELRPRTPANARAGAAGRRPATA